MRLGSWAISGVVLISVLSFGMAQQGDPPSEPCDAGWTYSDADGAWECGAPGEPPSEPCDAGWTYSDADGAWVCPSDDGGAGTQCGLGEDLIQEEDGTEYCAPEGYEPWGPEACAADGGTWKSEPYTWTDDQGVEQTESGGYCEIEWDESQGYEDCSGWFEYDEDTDSYVCVNAGDITPADCGPGETFKTEDFSYTEEDGTTQTTTVAYCEPADAGDYGDWKSPCPDVEQELLQEFQPQFESLTQRIEDLEARLDAEVDAAVDRDADEAEFAAIHGRYDPQVDAVEAEIEALNQEMQSEFFERCPAGADDYHEDETYGVSPECEAFVARYTSSEQEFSSRQSTQYQQFHDAIGAEVADFSATTHSQAEWDAFHQRTAARQQEFEQAQEGEWNAFYAQLDFSVCGEAPEQLPPWQVAAAGSAALQGATCEAQFSSQDLQMLESTLSARREEFRQTYIAPTETALRQDIQRELGEFRAGNPTAEALAEFEALEQRKLATFLSQAEAAAVAAAEEQRGSLRAFLGSDPGGCIDVEDVFDDLGDDAWFDAPDKYQDEQDEVRVAFYLELQARALAADRDLRDQFDQCKLAQPESECQKEYEARRAALEAELNADTGAFEDELAGDWEETFWTRMALGEPDDRIGDISYDEAAGEVRGRYASFTIDRTNALVRRWAHEGSIVFDLISTTEERHVVFDPAYNSQVQLAGEKTVAFLADDPQAGLFFSATAGSPHKIILDFADHLSLEEQRISESHVLTVGGIEGGKVGNLVITEGSIEIRANNNVLLQGTAHWVVDTEKDIMDAGVPQEVRDQLREAVRLGTVGMDANVVSRNGAIDNSFVRFAQMNMRIEQVDAGDIRLANGAALGAQGLEFVVDSQRPDGKALSFTIEKEALLRASGGGTLPGNLADAGVRFQVKLCDAAGACQDLVQASSPEDVLNALDDEGVGEYTLTEGAAGVRALVSVPSFSEKVIRIVPTSAEAQQAAPPTTLPVKTPGLEPIAVLVGVAVAVAIGPVRRKRYRRSR